MKFLINSTYDKYDDDDNTLCPVEGAYNSIEEGETITGEPRKVWIIEINSIEELLDLSAKLQNPLIVCDSTRVLYPDNHDVGYTNPFGISSIEIYNGWRE